MEGELKFLIPIIAIVMGIGLGAWAIYWDHQKRRLQHEERRLMIEEAPPRNPWVRKPGSGDGHRGGEG